MKKKVVSIFLCAVLAATVLPGCTKESKIADSGQQKRQQDNGNR